MGRCFQMAKSCSSQARETAACAFLAQTLAISLMVWGAAWFGITRRASLRGQRSFSSPTRCGMEIISLWITFAGASVFSQMDGFFKQEGLWTTMWTLITTQAHTAFLGGVTLCSSILT